MECERVDLSRTGPAVNYLIWSDAEKVSFETNHNRLKSIFLKWSMYDSATSRALVLIQLNNPLLFLLEYFFVHNFAPYTN